MTKGGCRKAVFILIAGLALPAGAVGAEDMVGAGVDEQTGIEFVRIPGGAFQMGSNDWDADEKPPHETRVRDFLIGKTEVTVAQFRRFVEATGHVTQAENENWCWTYNPAKFWRDLRKHSWRSPGFEQGDDHPVVCVSWWDAAAYAWWAGGRLPTEAEWEFAAANGERHTLHQWGNDAPNGDAGGNLSDAAAHKELLYLDYIPEWDDGAVYTMPAGSFAPNDFGLLDASGNVWEWVQDWFGEYPETAVENPAGPAEGTFRVLRGGSWRNDLKGSRLTRRIVNEPSYRNSCLGFRIVRDVPPPEVQTP